MELELLQWPDGSVHLYYADYMHGHDRDFTLCIDGSCEETITHEDGGESHQVINLVLVLREMLAVERALLVRPRERGLNCETFHTKSELTTRKCGEK
jgi:hypothetical protein